MKPWPDPGDPPERPFWLTFEFVGIAAMLALVAGYMMFAN